MYSKKYNVNLVLGWMECCIIPFQLQQEDNYTTFEDVLDAIEEAKTMINSKLAIVRSFGSMNVVDLKNATILKQNNFTFDDVWQFSPSVMIAYPYPIGICTTVNPPHGIYLPLKKDMFVQVTLFSSSASQPSLPLRFLPCFSNLCYSALLASQFILKIFIV